MRYGRLMLAALMALAIGLLCGAHSASLFAAPGLAEGITQPELEINASVSNAPNIPGEAMLSFTLVNRSDVVLTGLCLVMPDGSTATMTDKLTPAESISFAHSCTVSQEELDAGFILLTVTGEADGLVCSYPVEVSLLTDAGLQVDFLRQISNQSVAEGGSATIVYRVCNTGSISVSDLSITDSPGSFGAQCDRLAPGETWTAIQHVSVTEAVISAPVLTYSTDSAADDFYTSQLDERTIRPAQSRLDATLTAGRSLFDPGTAEIILTLANSGDVDYHSIRIYDDIYGGIIADSIQLSAGGESVEIAHSYPLRGDGSYRWRIIGETAAGDPVDFITETVSVRDETGDNVLLTLAATPSMTRINRNGYVPVTLELTNIGSALATNVLIHEETLGEIRQLAVVPTGGPTCIQVRLDVTENTVYTFYATYVDRYGQQRTAAAEPVEITIGAGGVSPERDVEESTMFGGASMHMGNSSLFLVLLIGSIVVLITLIVVLLITSRRAHMRRKERTAARKQRVREEMGKTNRFKPIRRNPKK